MNLKELMVDTKAVWIDFPGCEGFEVQVVNLSRKEMIALRKRCLVTKLDRKTRQMSEELNEDKFVEEFSRSTITGWKGLKLKYLKELILVDLKGQDEEAELEYSEENAQLLVSSSSEFDSWLNEVVFDLNNFR